MTTLKESLDREIKISIANHDTVADAVRRLFLFNSSSILQANREKGFRIINEVSRHFNIPFRSIAVSGSAHTGYSYFKERDFIPGSSDLDLAIIDPSLFIKYSELVYIFTKGYTDFTRFSLTENGVSTVHSFREYLCRGYFRPDLMPEGNAKQEWFEFFNRLSERYSDLFESINGGIFLSQRFFEGKQAPTILKFRKENA